MVLQANKLLAIATTHLLVLVALGSGVSPASASSLVTYVGEGTEASCAQTVTGSSGAVQVSRLVLDSKEYCVVDFKNSDNAGSLVAGGFSSPVFSWSPPAGVTQIDYFVVAGGGGGSGAWWSDNVDDPNRIGAGGGGAGGVLSGSGLSVDGPVGIAVGYGGNGSPGTKDSGPVTGSPGGPSAISTTGANDQAHGSWTISASGGGRGQSQSVRNIQSMAGGSAGGAVGSNLALGPGIGIEGQGNSGGLGATQVDGGIGRGNAGGGGGKSSQGDNATLLKSGSGGDGVLARIGSSAVNDFGISEIFAAGGGGGAAITGKNGGSGGSSNVGGAGGNSSLGAINATAPISNTGSGGGGGGEHLDVVGSGSKGSAGRVLIRYEALKQQNPLSLGNVNVVFGANASLNASGGSGTGTITYSVVAGGTATGCGVSSEGVATSASAGTCFVTATRSGDSTYLPITSAQSTITFDTRVITISASSSTVTVGATFSPSFTVSAGSLFSSDTISETTFRYAGSGSTVYTSSTTRPTAVGTYSVTPEAAVFSSGLISNYDVSYSPGILTISAAAPANSSSPSSGGIAPAIPTPESDRNITFFENPNFNGRALPKKLRREIKASVREMKDVSRVVCVAFVGGPGDNALTKRQARSLATKACRVVQRLEPDVEVKIGIRVAGDDASKSGGLRLAKTGR